MAVINFFKDLMIKFTHKSFVLFTAHLFASTAKEIINGIIKSLLVPS